jgi:hypothetical protein
MEVIFYVPVLAYPVNMWGNRVILAESWKVLILSRDLVLKERSSLYAGKIYIYIYIYKFLTCLLFKYLGRFHIVMLPGDPNLLPGVKNSLNLSLVPTPNSKNRTRQ